MTRKERENDKAVKRFGQEEMIGSKEKVLEN